MRATILAMTVMTVVFAQAQSKPSKSMPADVGPGHVAWFDITTTDLSKSKEFYGKLFDWKFNPATELGGTLVPGFPFNLPNGTGAIGVVSDPSGHPLGMYSRTPIAPRKPPSK